MILMLVFIVAFQSTNNQINNNKMPTSQLY